MRRLVAVLAAAAPASFACAKDDSPSGPRPSTTARLEIVQPTPDATMPPSFKLELRLVGAQVAPAGKTTGPLKGDEGHIHVTLDGKLISMAYGTAQDLTNLAAGPHNLQAEFVAVDHAPSANRVIVGVASAVTAAGATSP